MADIKIDYDGLTQGGIVPEESGDDLRRALHPDEDDDRTDFFDLGGQCEQGIYGDDG